MAETVITNRQLDSADGWIPAQETWTYASANSFTVSGVDVTDKYPKGTKLKFTNGSVKYKYVASTSFSTNTTINTIDDDNYDLADAAITSPYYSYMESPQGFPDYFTFTTTYTGFSSDPSVSDLIYRVDGAWLTFDLPAQTGTSNSATFDFTVPIAPDFPAGALYRVYIVKVYNNNSHVTQPGVIGLADASTTVKVGLDPSTTAANAYGGFATSNNKAVWAHNISYPF